MRLSRLGLVLLLAVSLSGCQAASKLLDAANARSEAEAAAKASEEARNAAEHRCMDQMRATMAAVPDRLKADPASGLAMVEGVDLSECPNDIKAPYTALALALRDIVEQSAAYRENQSQQGAACVLGLGLQLFENANDVDTGLTPCSDSIAEDRRLRERVELAGTRMSEAANQLKVAFAAHGYVNLGPRDAS